MVTRFPPWPYEHPIDYQEIREHSGMILVENKQRKVKMTDFLKVNPGMHKMHRYDKLIIKYLDQIN